MTNTNGATAPNADADPIIDDVIAPPNDSAVAAFEPVPIADLPKSAPKGMDPASIALGLALLAVLTSDTAARDPMAHALRKDAINRAAVLKRVVRAAGGVSDGFRLGTRILAAADGFHVVATLDTISPTKITKTK